MPQKVNSGSYKITAIGSHIVELLQSGMYVDAIVKNFGYERSTVSHHARKLGLNQKKLAYDWNLVQSDIDLNMDYKDICEKHGFNKTSFHKAARRGDIDLGKKFKDMNFAELCDATIGKRATSYQMNLYRKFLSEKNGLACVICELKTWMGNPITMQVDHIDGVRNNNSMNNMRLLCPNCHAQTLTWRGRNKAFQRKKLSNIL